jgi:hypothetical protein
MTDQDQPLADDLLHGGAAIGAFLGLKPGATFYGLQRGYIPATKRGNSWIGSKSRLKAHFNGDVEPKRQAAPNTEITANT